MCAIPLRRKVTRRCFVVKNKKNIILLIVAISLVLVAAAPFSMTTKRLSISNESKDPVYLYLTGDQYYYFSVAPGSDAVYTPEAGDYTYKLTACGATKTGTLDLTKNASIVVPACGSHYRTNYDDVPENDIDAGKLVRILRLSIENDEDSNLWLIVTGPSTYVFRFTANETKDMTLAAGDYDYTIYGCGTVAKGILHLDQHDNEYSLTCKKVTK